MTIKRIESKLEAEQCHEFFMGPGSQVLLTPPVEPEVAGIYNENFSLTNIQNRLGDSENYAYYLSSRANGVINGGLFGLLQDGQAGMAGLIDSVAVTELRKGIGRILVRQFEEDFKSRVKFFAAWINESNVPSQKLFESLGYKHEGAHPKRKDVRGYYKDL